MEMEDLVWWSGHLDGEGSKMSKLVPPLERTNCTQDKQGEGEGEDKFSQILSQFE